MWCGKFKLKHNVEWEDVCIAFVCTKVYDGGIIISVYDGENRQHVIVTNYYSRIVLGAREKQHFMNDTLCIYPGEQENTTQP